jgi:hypothetical protein
MQTGKMWRSRLRGVSVHTKWLIAVVVVAVLMGGSATAALKITGKNVANSSLTGLDIRDSSVTGADIKDRSLTARDFRDSIRGPEGPIGPQGPRGPAGLSLLIPALAGPVSIPADGDPHGVIAWCDPGQTVVSGGYAPVAYPPLILVIASNPVATQDGSQEGWDATVVNADTSSGAGDFEVVAQCADSQFQGTAAAQRRSAIRSYQQNFARLRQLVSRGK